MQANTNELLLPTTEQPDGPKQTARPPQPPPTTNSLHSSSVDHRKQGSPLDMATLQQEPIAAKHPTQLNICILFEPHTRAQDTKNH